MLPFQIKENFKIEDILLESIVIFAMFIVMVSIWKLYVCYRHNKNWNITIIGIALYLIGGILDLLDEFFRLPQIIPRVIENGFIAIGISLFSIGMVIIVKELIGLVNIDPMTGVCNKNYFVKTLKSEINKSIRYSTPLSLIFLDINKFKRINDVLGHKAGDLVLINITKKINETIRSVDIMARFGGDEFIILLPNSNFSDAEQLLNRINKTISNLEIPRNLSIGISGGIASFPEDSDDPERLI